MVSISQLPDVRRLLDSNRIPYWVDEDAISLDGEPEVSVINLRGDADPKSIQRMLDAIP